MICWEETSPLWSSQKPWPALNHHITQSWGHSISYLTNALQSQGHEKQGKGICHKLEENKETRKLNAIWDPGLDSETEKGHWWKVR